MYVFVLHLCAINDDDRGVTTDVYIYSSGYRTGSLNILWPPLDANQYGRLSLRSGSIFSCCKGLWDVFLPKPITTKHQCVFWLVSQSRQLPVDITCGGLCWPCGRDRCHVTTTVCWSGCVLWATVEEKMEPEEPVDLIPTLIPLPPDEVCSSAKLSFHHSCHMIACLKRKSITVVVFEAWVLASRRPRRFRSWSFGCFWS